MKKQIAVLGGLFDPPHFGHLLVARQVLESHLCIDLVLLMPVFKHPWRENQVSWRHRLKMLSFFENSKIKTSDFEIKLGKTSYTIQTVKELKKDKNNDYFWIIGSDGLKDFHKWKDWKKLLKETHFIVFPRAGFSTNKSLKGSIVLKDKNLAVTSLSSTMIRQRIKKNLPIAGLVPEGVEKYIKKNGLYKN